MKPHSIKCGGRVWREKITEETDWVSGDLWVARYADNRAWAWGEAGLINGVGFRTSRLAMLAALKARGRG